VTASDSLQLTTPTPTIIPRSQHRISRADISENALKVLYRLHEVGHQAYLVGGSVRDLLLGKHPKDFDVVTDAHPKQVNALFRNCRLIGRRFRLAHIYFGREIIEVATFRALIDIDKEQGEDAAIKDGRIIRDNVYGTIEEDVVRRDFTVNALYYNITDLSIVDYMNGMEDLSSHKLKIIGDPVLRYREDPVRMLRAVRHAAKLSLSIEERTKAAIFNCNQLLNKVPAARLFDEVVKLFHNGCAAKTFEFLRHYKLFESLFPLTEQCLQREAQQNKSNFLDFIIRCLCNTDDRIEEHKPVTPAFLYAVFLWQPMCDIQTTYTHKGMNEPQALQAAGHEITFDQIRYTTVPKRFSSYMREIWKLQARFDQRFGKRPYRLLCHPRFRAAYDFMCLRMVSDDTDNSLCNWWTQFQVADSAEQKSMISKLKKNR